MWQNARDPRCVKSGRRRQDSQRHPMRFHYLLILAAAFAAAPAAAVDVNVIGLFPGKAVVVIDRGAPRTLSVGQRTSEGVLLVSVDSSSALLEVEGKRERIE